MGGAGVVVLVRLLEGRLLLTGEVTTLGFDGVEQGTLCVDGVELLRLQARKEGLVHCFPFQGIGLQDVGGGLLVFCAGQAAELEAHPV